MRSLPRRTLGSCSGRGFRPVSPGVRCARGGRPQDRPARGAEDDRRRRAARSGAARWPCPPCASSSRRRWAAAGAGRWIKTVTVDSLPEGEPKRVALVADHRDAWTLEKDVELGAAWLLRKGSDDHRVEHGLSAPRLRGRQERDGRRLQLPLPRLGVRRRRPAADGPLAARARHAREQGARRVRPRRVPALPARDAGERARLSPSCRRCARSETGFTRPDGVALVGPPLAGPPARGRRPVGLGARRVRRDVLRRPRADGRSLDDGVRARAAVGVGERPLRAVHAAGRVARARPALLGGAGALRARGRARRAGSARRRPTGSRARSAGGSRSSSWASPSPRGSPAASCRGTSSAGGRASSRATSPDSRRSSAASCSR